MTLITKALGAFKGRTAKLAGAVAATLLLAPIPALGFTFLTSWSFSTLTVNAPAPATSTSDFATGTQLTVDMGKNGITTQAGAAGSSVNPGAISFFTAQRDISVGATGENVNIVRNYQTLLQGASLQSIVYFVQNTGANAGARVNVTPNNVNAAGARFGRTFSFADATPVNVNLGPGTYTIFVRLKYKKDRYGIWDNSSPLPGSPHTFTISSAVGP
jgi:hypothetical protein